MGKNKNTTMGNGLLGKAGEVFVDKTTENKSLCKKMPLRQRIYGWGICFCLGFLISLASSGMIKTMVKGEYVKFGALYSTGTILTLASSFFLWGPTAQCKNMFDPTRRLVTVIYLSLIGAVIGATILAAKNPDFKGSAFIIMALIFAQYLAAFWYGLSFVPMGRKIFCKCCKKHFDD